MPDLQRFVSVSQLKAQLSASLKVVREGGRIVVMDHNRPVAALVPLESERLTVVQKPSKKLVHKDWPSLVSSETDLEKIFQEVRSDKW